MKTVLFAGASVAVLSLSAAQGVPTVSNVRVEQDRSRTVTISYTLDRPAIVTLDVLTNGVSIGMENVQGLQGDVHRLVTETSERTITWKPYESWVCDTVRHTNASVKVTAWATNAPPDWMVVDLTKKGAVNYYATTNAMPVADITDDVYKTTRLVMRKIPARFVRWRQGAAPSQKGALDTWAFHFCRFVTLSHDYYIGIYPVTQRQYYLMMTSGITTTLSSNPSAFADFADSPMRPVNKVSYDAIRGNASGTKWPNADRATAHKVDTWTFMYAIRQWTGLLFDLPTEAQWEFAALGGNYDTSWYWGASVGDSAAEMNPRMWSGKNCKVDGTEQVHPVGLLEPNAYGLYDLFGNVREWTLDWDVASQAAISNAEAYDPVGEAAGTARVYRGGAYSDSYKSNNATYRNRTSTTTAWGQCGFRLAIPLYR